MDELESLLATLGIEIHSKLIQKCKKYSSRFLVGSGKVDEIKQQVEESCVQHVVFDQNLSPPQFRNLQEYLKVQVSDRTGVILAIFKNHARSSAAKIQVEIAELEYLLPRMVGAWTHFGRQSGGGAMNRGMGESQIEVDRRRARSKISRLKKKLSQINADQHQQSKSRSKELSVSLVGYTNSGKSTLMRAMTDANVLVEDKLFATLEAKVRTLDPRMRPRILLTDTVGFISDTPHELIECFKSTLEEALRSDLLLHVVDISKDNYRRQIETTEEVLQEIGAGDVPQMIVFNKIDQIDDKKFLSIMKKSYKNSVLVCAQEEASVQSLRDVVYNFFEANLLAAKLVLGVEQRLQIAKVYRNCMVLESDYESNPGQVVLSVQATRANLGKFSTFLLESNLESKE